MGKEHRFDKYDLEKQSSIEIYFIIINTSICKTIKLKLNH